MTEISRANAVYDALNILRSELVRLASLLPEFDVVTAMQGAGPITGPQLMAEIGDVRRFTHKGALVAFAGMDAPPFQSGTFDSKSRQISKRGSTHLRKILFTICSIILQHSNPENPVFQFMDKKRSEGKHFYVYMVAGGAKFLRIYYAQVKEVLDAQDTLNAQTQSWWQHSCHAWHEWVTSALAAPQCCAPQVCKIISFCRLCCYAHFGWQ